MSTIASIFHFLQNEEPLFASLYLTLLIDEADFLLLSSRVARGKKKAVHSALYAAVFSIGQEAGWSCVIENHAKC